MLKIKYICQQIEKFSYEPLYSTMFDEGYGIAIYAGYLVPKCHKGFGIFPRVVKWSQDKGFFLVYILFLVSL
jgi:hypothetical protein